MKHFFGSETLNTIMENGPVVCGSKMSEVFLENTNRILPAEEEKEDHLAFLTIRKQLKSRVFAMV